MLLRIAEALVILDRHGMDFGRLARPGASRYEAVAPPASAGGIVARSAASSRISA